MENAKPNAKPNAKLNSKANVELNVEPNVEPNAKPDNNTIIIKVRGRPKKEVIKEVKAKGQRGRPPKEEKKETCKVEEDLIGRLLREAKEKQNKK
jgi:hypothetical protein